MAVGSFRLPISAAAAPSTGWTPPADWIDISTVADNEINLLVKESVALSFKVGVDSLACTFTDIGDLVNMVAHGYANNDIIQFESVINTTGISEYTNYYIVNKTDDAFQVSLTSGGAAILLTTDGLGYINGSGTFSVDWGDGVIVNNIVSGTLCEHTHTINGTPCSLGYNTWKVRIYGANGVVTRWSVRLPQLPTYNYSQSILWAVFGTVGITNYSNTFYLQSNPGNINNYNLQSCVIPDFTSCLSTLNMFRDCYALQSVIIPSSWGSVLSTMSMFYNCYSLLSIILPNSWNSITMIRYMFNGCYSLTSITIPSSWDNITDIQYSFYNCYSLTSIILPNSWGNITITVYAFGRCFSLQSITLPNSFGNITNVTRMFYGCSNLSIIDNEEYLGSQSALCNFFDCFSQSQSLLSISIGSLLSSFGMAGSSGPPIFLKVNSIRLTNSGSTFGEGSPQINVSYTSLDATALNLLFGDLPTLTGKTINITDCTGAATCTRSIATTKGWTVTG